MSRLHERLMRVIIGDVAAGALAPGDWLPRETDLAQQFGVSRGVARECIRGLEERRLIAVTHGRGAVVRDEREWDVLNPEVLTALLPSSRGPELIRELLETRRLLEPEAAALAAERATPGDLTRLSEALERMVASARRAPGNAAAEDLYHEADLAFHRAVLTATGSRPLRQITAPVERALAAARRPLARPGLRAERSLPEHRAILTAIAARDAAAAREAMRVHLVTVEAYLRELTEGTAHTDRG